MTETNHVQALEAAIMALARQEAQAIVNEARGKAEALRAEAEAHAAAESAAIVSAAETQVPQLIAQAAAKAQVEAQMLKLQRREQVIARAFAAARQRLATLPQRADYAAIVRRLLDEALAALDSDTYIIHADVQTQAVLTAEVVATVERERRVTLRLGDALDDGVGLVATTADGRRRYDNTFAARLARIEDNLRAEVYHILAGDI